MLVKKTIETKIKGKLDISGITLLSVEEYEAARRYIPKINSWWWLRSPGGLSGYAAHVNTDGSVYVNGNTVHHDEVVRPALRIRNLDSLNLNPGDKIIGYAGYSWTVIPGDMILCDDNIGKHCFHHDWEAGDANVYEKSDVKRFVEDWWEKNKPG